MQLRKGLFEMKNKKKRTSRVQSVDVVPLIAKTGNYWWTLPLDKKGRFIPSSVDCLYSQEYYSRTQAAYMTTSM